MSGLLLKDLLILRAGWKVYTFVVLFFAAFSLVGIPTYFSSMLAIFLLIQPMSSFSTDELARWDKFAAVLPGGKRAMVRAKYQFLFLVSGGVIVLSCLVDLVIALFGRGDWTWLELTVISLVSVWLGVLLNLFLYPFLFRFGTQKARLVLGIVSGVIFAVFAIGVSFLSIGGRGISIELTMLPPLLAGLVVLVAAASVISYRISCRIYEKKEF